MSTAASVEGLQSLFLSLSLIGSSPAGYNLLAAHAVLPTITRIAVSADNFLIREAAFQAVGLLATASSSCPALRRDLQAAGWMLSESTHWPVAMPTHTNRHVVQQNSGSSHMAFWGTSQSLVSVSPFHSYSYSYHPTDSHISGVSDLGMVSHQDLDPLHTAMQLLRVNDATASGVPLICNVSRFGAAPPPSSNKHTDSTSPTSLDHPAASSALRQTATRSYLSALWHISCLCNHVTAKAAFAELRRLKQRHPPLFRSTHLLMDAHRLLATYSYTLHARQFILHELLDQAHMPVVKSAAAPASGAPAPPSPHAATSNHRPTIIRHAKLAQYFDG